MNLEQLTAPMIRTLLAALARRMYTADGVVYQISGSHSTVKALIRRELAQNANRQITQEDGTPDHQSTATWLTEAGARKVRRLLEKVLSRPGSDRPEVYREFLTEPRRSESLAAFLLGDAHRIATTDDDRDGNVDTGTINREDGRQQLGSALRQGYRVTLALTAVTVHAPDVRYTFAPLQQEQPPHADEQQSAPPSTAVRRFHMRTVHGGTPERIASTEALSEINAAIRTAAERSSCVRPRPRKPPHHTCPSASATPQATASSSDVSAGTTSAKSTRCSPSSPGQWCATPPTTTTSYASRSTRPHATTLCASCGPHHPTRTTSLPPARTTAPHSPPVGAAPCGTQHPTAPTGGTAPWRADPTPSTVNAARAPASAVRTSARRRRSATPTAHP